MITALGGTVLPTTVLLDADGKVVATHTGELDADELRDAAGRQARHRAVIDAPLALAFGAGMLATVNPCGFAMLPAYLGYFLGADGHDRDVRASVQRSLGVGLSVSAGFLAVFSVVGLAIYHLSASVDRWTPWATIVIGVGLVVLGLAMLRGLRARRVAAQAQPGRARPHRPVDVRVRRVLRHRVDLVRAARSSPARWSARSAGRTCCRASAVFVAYSLGMTLVLLALTVSMGMARQSILRWLRQALPVRHPGVGRCCSSSPAPTSSTTAGTSGGCERATSAAARRPSTPSPAGPTRSPAGSTTSAPTRLGLLLALGAGRRAHRHLRRPHAPALVAHAVGRFAELLAHDGVEEDLELRSTFGFMAFHGGNLEEGTDVIAAGGRRRSRRLALRRAPARRAALARAVDRGDPRRLAVAGRVPRPRRRGGGASTATAATACGPRSCSAAATARWPPTWPPHLRAGLPGYTVVDDLDAIPRELRGVHRANPVNRCAGRRGAARAAAPGAQPHARSGPTSRRASRSPTAKPSSGRWPPPPVPGHRLTADAGGSGTTTGDAVPASDGGPQGLRRSISQPWGRRRRGAGSAGGRAGGWGGPARARSCRARGGSRPSAAGRGTSVPSKRSSAAAKRASSVARSGRTRGLVRRPRRRAGCPGAGSPSTHRSRPRSTRCDGPAEVDLAVHRHPAEQQRRLRVGGQVLALAALVVGEERAGRARRGRGPARCGPTGGRRRRPWRARRRSARSAPPRSSRASHRSTCATGSGATSADVERGRLVLLAQRVEVHPSMVPSAVRRGGHRHDASMAASSASTPSVLSRYQRTEVGRPPARLTGRTGWRARATGWPGSSLEQRAHGAQPVGPGHHEVEHDDVGPELAGQLERTDAASAASATTS